MYKVLGMQKGAKVHIMVLFKASSGFIVPIIVGNLVLFFFQSFLMLIFLGTNDSAYNHTKCVF